MLRKLISRPLARTLAAFLGIVGLAVPVTQVAGATAALAAYTNILSCSSAGVSGDISPDIIPIIPRIIEADGAGAFGSCTDLQNTGINDASLALTAESIVICVPAINPVEDVVIGPEATGTVTINWSGGGGGSTTFNWIVAGAFSIGIASAIDVTGTSTSGRFHDGLPAVFNAVLQLDDLSPSCVSGIDSYTAHTNTFVVADVL
jgi:hypothetical protein